MIGQRMRPGTGTLRVPEPTPRGTTPGPGRRAARAVGLTAALAAVLLGSGCSTATPPPPAAPPPPTAAPAAPAAPRDLTIWLTGYSWQDNTPPGSSVVGEPVLHREAGGTGSFADPITVATPGHQGHQAWPPGTRFYLPTVRRYVMVEDSGAAKAPSGTDTHLDMWIGGQDGTRDQTDDCESAFTGRVPAQVDPPADLPVMPGPIFAGGACHVPPQPPDRGTYDDAESSGDN